LPVELNLHVNRVTIQDTLSSEEYRDMMMDEVEDLMEKHFEALREIEKEKVRAAKEYNKRVQEKSFQINNMVWKMILPLGSWDNKFGKGSPSWEGLIKLLGLCSGTLTSWKLWKDGCYIRLLTGDI
jgi:hypothetical protein